MIKYIVYRTYLKRRFIMNKIKDFFYNKNDIIIVLIILVAAAFIIYGRIGAIMDYPKVFAEKTEESQQIESATEEEAVVPSSSEGQKAQSSAGAVSSSAESGSVKSDSGYISLVIKDSDTSSSVAQKLYKAGVVDSAKDFERYIKKKGKAKSIKSGKFKIPTKASDKEILNIIAN